MGLHDKSAGTASAQSPVSHDTPKLRTLRRALEVLGSESNLAEALEVTREQIRQWLSGAQVPDDAAYLLALDIVVMGRRALYRRSR